MRKALMLALTLEVVSAGLGLEAIANSSERVSSIAIDQRAIKSTSSGKIPLSKEICEDFITQPALLGKIAYAFGFSPYLYQTNALGETTFLDKKGSVSTVKYSRDYSTPDTLRKEIEIQGIRSFSDFKAYIDLRCIKEKEETRYNSTMYILLENRLARWALKGLRALPYTGEKIEKLFKAEQDSVGNMMAELAKEMQRDSKGFQNAIRNGTNGVSFTQQEIDITEKYMKKHGFLK